MGSNQFNSANYPTTEPTQILADSFVAWKRPDLMADYPAVDYSLSYVVVPDGGGRVIEIPGDNFIFKISRVANSRWAAGTYRWQLQVRRIADSEGITLATGSFVVQVTPWNGADPRSHLQIVVDNIEAVLEKRATRDQESYTIEGRSLARTPIGDLLKLRDRYKAELRRQAQGLVSSAGSSDRKTFPGRRLQVRFHA